jgi:syntaxin 6
MLGDLSGRVDDTDSRLRKVSRTMQDFIRRNEGKSATLVLSNTAPFPLRFFVQIQSASGPTFS